MENILKDGLPWAYKRCNTLKFHALNCDSLTGKHQNVKIFPIKFCTTCIQMILAIAINIYIHIYIYIYIYVCMYVCMYI